MSAGEDDVDDVEDFDEDVDPYEKAHYLSRPLTHIKYVNALFKQALDDMLDALVPATLEAALKRLYEERDR